jgi:hypothetical protein
MDILKNKKIFDYSYRAVLSLLVLFILYNLVSIFFVSRFKERKLWSRVSSATRTLEANLKRAHPPEGVEEDAKETKLAHQVNNIHFKKSITKTSIFAGPIRGGDVVTEKEMDVKETNFTPVERKIPIPTQISLKGVADRIALVNVRRKINEVWYEHSFPLRNSEQIGAEKIIKNVKYDFTTNCVIKEIINKVERPVVMRKKVVLLSDAGKFIGTKMVPGDTFMKNTSKIIYRDEEGVTKELWLGESQIITEEPKEKPSWREDPLGAAKSKYDNASSNIKEKLTKGKKPGEMKVE